LLAADVGPAVSKQLLSRFKSLAAARGASDIAAAKQIAVDAIVETLLPEDSRQPKQSEARPTVILVVGVNGTGKTTSVAKLGALFASQGAKVVLAAADTFRAAAVSQLRTWAERTGARLVAGPEKADPAAVAFDALTVAREELADYLLVDTAGRLHTSSALMAELAKVRRVLERQAEVAECLLVLDATTGQNGLAQAKKFAEQIQVSGLILTKFDGTAKGGVVLAVEQDLGVPVKYVGVGEDLTDIEVFNAVEFAEALVTPS
jgi:fused signal recognition particle receptor